MTESFLPDELSLCGATVASVLYMSCNFMFLTPLGNNPTCKWYQSEWRSDEENHWIVEDKDICCVRKKHNGCCQEILKGQSDFFFFLSTPSLMPFCIFQPFLVSPFFLSGTYWWAYVLVCETEGFDCGVSGKWTCQCPQVSPQCHTQSREHTSQGWHRHFTLRLCGCVSEDVYVNKCVFVCLCLLFVAAVMFVLASVWVLMCVSVPFILPPELKICFCAELCECVFVSQVS